MGETLIEGKAKVGNARRERERQTESERSSRTERYVTPKPSRNNRIIVHNEQNDTVRLVDIGKKIEPTKTQPQHKRKKKWLRNLY